MNEEVQTDTVTQTGIKTEEIVETSATENKEMEETEKTFYICL